MKKPHPYAEFIKAKADGHQIQYKGPQDDLIWHDMNDEDWNFQGPWIFRIKPEPEYPKSRMSFKELAACVSPYQHHQGFNYQAIADAAIKRAIQDGDVVIAKKD